jgi:ABC-type antimicrobial peptide transport system permease subunit
LLLWIAAVGTVLLIVCANIANLLLARAAVRQKEMALRAALGANRGRLIRQLLTESVLLALLGGIAGTLAAVWGVHALNRAVPFTIVGRPEDFTLDGRVFAFSCVLSILCGVAFGLAPVRQSTRRTLNETLESAGRGTAIGGLGTRRAGRLLVVAQLALAVVLSCSALLLVPLFYLPSRQNPAWLMHLVVRTRSNPFDAAPAVRRAVWSVDKHQPVFDTKSMEDVVAETFSQPRVLAGLTGTFASVALLLAAVGVYGLLSYVVSQRTREIGIRMALGARRQDMLRAILYEGAHLGLVGVAVGLAASFGLTRLLAGLLFGVGAADPLTFAAVGGLLFGVTLAACLVPACRALRVDPLVALRCK